MNTKLGKEEIQKMVLGGIMAIIVVYVYFTVLLGPLQGSQEASRQKQAGLHPKIADAQKQIKQTAALEIAAPKSTITVKELTALIPEGSPVAWFPPQVNDFFKREGIEKVTTRMNNESQDKDLTGFRKISWAIEIPKVEFGPFAQAVADFENEQLLAEIAGLQIEMSKEDPEFQHINLTVNNIVKQ